MTNPFKRLKQLNAAEVLMRAAGFEGNNIFEHCECAIALIQKQMGVIAHQNEAMDQASAAMAKIETPQSEPKTFRYLVPYDVHHSEFLNGGKKGIRSGMTMVEIEGGIRNWQQVLGVCHFIKSSDGVRELPNSSVVLNGLTLVDQFPTPKPAVVSVT